MSTNRPILRLWGHDYLKPERRYPIYTVLVVDRKWSGVAAHGGVLDRWEYFDADGQVYRGLLNDGKFTVHIDGGSMFVVPGQGIRGVIHDGPNRGPRPAW